MIPALTFSAPTARPGRDARPSPGFDDIFRSLQRDRSVADAGRHGPTARPDDRAATRHDARPVPGPDRSHGRPQDRPQDRPDERLTGRSASVRTDAAADDRAGRARRPDEDARVRRSRERGVDGAHTDGRTDAPGRGADPAHGSADAATSQRRDGAPGDEATGAALVGSPAATAAATLQADAAGATAAAEATAAALTGTQVATGTVDRAGADGTGAVAAHSDTDAGDAGGGAVEGPVVGGPAAAADGQADVATTDPDAPASGDHTAAPAAEATSGAEAAAGPAPSSPHSPASGGRPSGTADGAVPGGAQTFGARTAGSTEATADTPADVPTGASADAPSPDAVATDVPVPDAASSDPAATDTPTPATRLVDIRPRAFADGANGPDPRTAASRVDDATGVAELRSAGASAVSGRPSPTAAPTASSMVERIVAIAEQLRNAPPPRTVTVDLEALGGMRVVVSLRGEAVAVTPADGRHFDGGFNRDLSRSLAERGLQYDGDGPTGQSSRQRGGQQGARRGDEPYPAPSRADARPRSTRPADDPRGVRL